jgi:uncharacterized protein YecT (DUF1311 family)
MKRCIFFLLFCCVGATPEPNSFSQTDRDLARSAYARFQLADAELNRVYREFLASCDEVRKEKLVKAQRAWLAYRDAEASLESDGFRGGTGELLTANGVLANLTEERVKSLKDTFSSF